MNALKKHGFWLGFVTLSMCSIAAFVLLLMPELRANWANADKLARGQSGLRVWQSPKRQAELPNEAIVAAQQSYKDWLKQSYDEALAFFEARDQAMEQKLVAGDNVPPMLFRAKYVDKIGQLKRQMAKFGAAKLFPVERWEKGGDDLPDPVEYEWVTKRLWILEDICTVIRGMGLDPAGVENFAVKEPEAAPKAFFIDGKPLYNAVPVTLKLRMPFFKTANLIHQLLYPEKRVRKLATRIRSIHIEKIEPDSESAGGRTGALRQPLVRVTLELEYLDFQIPGAG